MEGAIVGSILEAQSTIASAVEEQTATTNAIAGGGEWVGEIARNISGVAVVAQSTSGGAANTQKAARELAEIATRLLSQVDQFRFDRAGPGGLAVRPASWPSAGGRPP